MSKPASPRKVGDKEALAVGTTIRGSARKLNLVAGLIRGRKVEEALNILKFSPKGMSEDVYKVLIGEGSDIGLATVYRVLMQFEQAGLLSRSNFESGKSVFELNEGQHHDHLVCLTCGRVEEFVDDQIERCQRNIAASRGFELQEHSLALYARCIKPDCEHRNK